MKKLVTLFSFVALQIISGSNLLRAQNITVTVAGNGTGLLQEDGGMSYLAEMGSPTDVCTDAAGNIYITDNDNAVIRKVSAKNGIISTYAGGGTSTADGIPATDAALPSPENMCIDAAGNLYVTTGSQVRKINLATGIITTAAGTGTAGFAGDGGAATAAELDLPGGICVDNAGNLYIVDGAFDFGSATHIRKVAAATGIITTMAGTAIPGYSGDGGAATLAQIASPTVICVDLAGNVFFADQPTLLGGGAYIRRIDAVSGMITTIAGTGGTLANGDGGPASAACLGNVYGLGFDADNHNLYLDDISCACRKIDMTTGIITTVAGNITASGYSGDGSNSLTELFGTPYGLRIDGAGNLLIADNANYRLRKVMMLSHTPMYAYGSGQYLNACPGIAYPLEFQLSVGGVDTGQVETWTVITPPVHGILSGFPANMISKGTDTVSVPEGTAYISGGSYSGIDSFQVRVSDGALSSTTTIYVSVNMAPLGSVSILLGDLCAGDTAYVSAGSPNGVWGSYNTTIATVDSYGMALAVSAGMDTIFYSTPLGCKASAFNVGPYAGTIAGPESVCVGSGVTVTNAVPGGVWSANNGNAAISGTGVVTGILAGTDIISYTVNNGCGTATASQEIVVNDCATGVNTVSTVPALGIFPNPATSVINIELANGQNISSLVITDITGRELYKATPANNSGGSMQIDIANLSAGVYFVKFNGSEVKKFVKE